MTGTGSEKKPELFIIDSCGWIEYFEEGELADKFEKYILKANPEEYLTPTIVLYEVFKKIKMNANEEEALRVTAQIKAVTTVVDIGYSVALSAADISIQEKIPMADSLIYSVARYYGATLITSDVDFKDMADVVYFEKK